MNDLLILETEHTTASQTDGYRIPGYVIVQPKAPCTQLSELSPEQATDLFACITEIEARVQKLIEPERIYILKFAELNPQVHFHVVPRTARIAEGYVKDVADEAPYVGARVVDWIWEHHASLKYTDSEISAFVAGARALSPDRD